MATPVPLRSDFDTIGLRMLARRSRDPDQTRRLLALAEIYDGGSRPDAARIGGVGCRLCATGLSVSTPKVLMVS
jgi:putative transposase